MRVFDIIGPIMIGPSSSHTAGAARIGRVARHLLGEGVERAQIGLYGSFASTYRGHGTDRALIAGLMDMAVDDARIRDGLDIARREGLDYSFEEVELRDAHPNTAVLSLTGVSGRTLSVRACSVGGGAIRVEELDGLAVSFSGDAHTVVVAHHDEPGVIAQVSSLLAGQVINIATMQVFRRSAGGAAVMVIEVDALPGDSALECLSKLRGVSAVRLIQKI